GLGSGGTSIPFFLEDRVRDRDIVLESEYALTLLEQGVLGLLLRVFFALWIMWKTWPGRAREWHLARLLLWGAVVFSFATGMIGTGVMTAIPQTALFMISCGWLMARSVDDRLGRRPAVAKLRPQEAWSI